MGTGRMGVYLAVVTGNQCDRREGRDTNVHSIFEKKRKTHKPLVCLCVAVCVWTKPKRTVSPLMMRLAVVHIFQRTHANSQWLSAWV